MTLVPDIKTVTPIAAAIIASGVKLVLTDKEGNRLTQEEAVAEKAYDFAVAVEKRVMRGCLEAGNEEAFGVAL